MKNRTGTQRICVLGNFSGRNAGDMAILGALIQDVSEQYPEVKFVVPTMNPGFVRRSFPNHDVEAVSLMPWALSLKILGLPVFRAVLSSDLVLVTDNILFDMKLLNPLFNYLFTLSLVLPLAKRRGIPVVLYNMSLGPVSTPRGIACFKRVIDSTELLILRDTQSRDLLTRLGMKHGPVEIRADCALNTRPAGTARLEEIIRNEGLFQNPHGTIGFNINAYLDAYIRRDGDSADVQLFSDVIAQTVDRLIQETSMDVLFIVTQVMDIQITEDVLRRVRNRQRVQVISNKDYSYQELTAVMGRLEILAGMRTHALILAASAGTPVVGIISYPKTAGFLESINQSSWTIPFKDLSAGALTGLVLQACRQRAQIREELLPAVETEREKARDAALLLRPYIKGQPEIAYRSRTAADHVP